MRDFYQYSALLVKLAAGAMFLMVIGIAGCLMAGGMVLTDAALPMSNPTLVTPVTAEPQIKRINGLNQRANATSIPVVDAATQTIAPSLTLTLQAVAVIPTSTNSPSPTSTLTATLSPSATATTKPAATTSTSNTAPAVIGQAVVGQANALTRHATCPCIVTVAVGWRLEQIAAQVDKLPLGFRGIDFLAATGASASVPAGFSRPAGKTLEGFIFPATYTLQNDTNAAQFRDMALAAFSAHINGQVQSDSAKRGLWQTLIMASIVQRESRSPAEMKHIASVFYNRIAAGKGLAATVTLQYALGRPGNWWGRVNNVNIHSPYNTYLYQGLPPTPIDSPGMDAILAAVYPAQSDDLYFAAKCGGGGNFYAHDFATFQAGLRCQ